LRNPVEGSAYRIVYVVLEQENDREKIAGNQVWAGEYYFSKNETNGVRQLEELLKHIRRVLWYDKRNNSLKVQEKGEYGFTAEITYPSDEVYQSMLHHLTDKKMRDAVAGDMGCSPTRFGAIYKERMGCSFSEGKRKLRLAMALDYVCNSNSLIDEIAHRVGYASDSALETAFKEQYGYSPGEIRRMSGKEKEAFLRLHRGL
jgi:AraC-like DNA-binding protein